MSLMPAIASELQDRGCTVVRRGTIIEITAINGANILLSVILNNDSLYVFLYPNPDPTIIHVADPDALDQLFALIPTQPGI